MNARNGKIARLPRSIRRQLNERLERSEESPAILPWLNVLPEVVAVLNEDFDGIPISKQNLSEWRQGGFQEWLARRELLEDALDITECAQEMETPDEGVLADAVATVLAARFGRLIANWNGEVDEKFEAKSRALNRLCRSVAQLQRGMHQANRESLELERLRKEDEKRDDKELEEKLLKPVWGLLKMPTLSKLFGGGTVGDKIATYILAVRRGDFNAEFDVLPTDKFGDGKPATKKAAPVKPTQKERSNQPARKTKARNTDNPLEESEMEVESSLDEPAQDQGQSRCVKPIEAGQ